MNETVQKEQGWTRNDHASLDDVKSDLKSLQLMEKEMQQIEKKIRELRGGLVKLRNKKKDLTFSMLQNYSSYSSEWGNSNIIFELVHANALTIDSRKAVNYLQTIE